MEKNYKMDYDEEIEENYDKCEICWEKMEKERKIKCNNMFKK
jgi:hypothetical protein